MVLARRAVPQFSTLYSRKRLTLPARRLALSESEEDDHVRELVDELIEADGDRSRGTRTV